MSPDLSLEKIGLVVGVAVSLLAVLKAGFAIARFFVTLAESVKSLTAAVETLTGRFDEHARHVTAELADVRERVARLEG